MPLKFRGTYQSSRRINYRRRFKHRCFSNENKKKKWHELNFNTFELCLVLIYIMCEFTEYIFLSCKIFEGELCLIEICLPEIKSFQIVLFS